MPHGEAWPRRHDLGALRMFGSTGEPWNPEPYRWLFEAVGQGRVPIMNYSGGTEISGGIIASFPNMPLKPCCFTGPIPGMAAEVFDDDGKPVRGQVGELVITRPWPGMTDRSRFEDAFAGFRSMPYPPYPALEALRDWNSDLLTLDGHVAGYASQVQHGIARVGADAGIHVLIVAEREETGTERRIREADRIVRVLLETAGHLLSLQLDERKRADFDGGLGE